MYTIIIDRIFWIYFIITLFFIIIGIGVVISSEGPYLIAISILWIIGNLALMIIVYHSHIFICENNIMGINCNYWLFINIIFVSLLIISTLWIGELYNSNSGNLKNMSGIIILLGGIILYKLSTLDLKQETNNYSLSEGTSISYWMLILYLIIWFGLTLYVIFDSN